MTVARVLPDVRGIDKTFDYVVPDKLVDHVRVGSLVRIDLHGRRVGGWVVALDVTPPPGVVLKPIARFSSAGPSQEILDLAEWAAWRWAGKPQHFLTTASPPTVVPALRPPTRPPARRATVAGAPAASMYAHDELLALPGPTVVRISPAGDLDALVADVAAAGPTVVVAASIPMARTLASSLERRRVTVARYPRQWAVAAAGAADVVVGARAAVWASMPGLAAIVVVDEHDEAHQSESSPTWHARDVAVERARRAGIACVLTSPCPSLDALARLPAGAAVLASSRVVERAGWPIVEIVDRAGEDPRTRTSLVSSALAAALASDRRVACVLNTKGVARLLACAACRSIARCETCDAAVAQRDATLVCARCGTTRPIVCTVCSASRMKNLRPGVSRLRAELEAATGGSVAEVTGASAGTARPTERVCVGTEAVLHQLERADVVAFLDFDAELLAPRFRAVEQAMALLARAARLVGGRAGGGRILVQTAIADHPVIAAAALADPGRLVAAELAQRGELLLPPVSALALISGAGAADYISGLRAIVGVEIQGPIDGPWLVRAANHDALCDALGATPRPAARLRVEVDPLRI